MTLSKLGMTPIEHWVTNRWKAWIPLLENEKYGLMMCYEVGFKRDHRKVVLREEFDTPEDARQFAAEWCKAQ